MDYVVFFKRHSRMVIAIASVLVLGMVAGVTFYLTAQYGNVGPNEKIYYDTNRHHRPLLNPNPQYYLTIVVTGDAQLLKQLQLHFLLTYYAADLGCMEPGYLWGLGAGYNPEITNMQWAKKQQKPPYVFVFALDRYQHDSCDWRATTLSSYNITDGSNPKKDANSSFRFEYENSMPLPAQAGGTLICDKKLKCERSVNFTNFGFGIPLKSYVYFLHFIKKQEN